LDFGPTGSPTLAEAQIDPLAPGRRTVAQPPRSPSASPMGMVRRPIGIVHLTPWRVSRVSRLGLVLTLSPSQSGA
jgi:hypothetical protein